MLIKNYCHFKKFFNTVNENTHPHFKQKFEALFKDLEEVFFYWGRVEMAANTTRQWLAKLKQNDVLNSNFFRQHLFTPSLSSSDDSFSKDSKEDILGAKLFFVSVLEPILSENDPIPCLKKALAIFNAEKLQDRLPKLDTLQNYENNAKAFVALKDLSTKPGSGLKILLDKGLLLQEDLHLISQRSVKELQEEFLNKPEVINPISEMDKIFGAQTCRQLLMTIFKNKDITLDNMLKLMYNATQFMDAIWCQEDTDNKGAKDSQETKEKKELFDYIELVSKEIINEQSKTMFQGKLADFMSTLYRRKFPEKPLEVVLKEFSGDSADVQFPLPQEELEKIKQQYLGIKKLEPELGLLSPEDLKQKLALFREALKKNSKDEETMIGLLALIREQVKRTFGLFPYNVQMLNVLAFLNAPNKKRLAQIKTGEGKSMTVAILAAFLGQTKTVDIAAPSEELALRDASKFRSFYDKLGLRVDAFSHANNNALNANIVYSSVYELEWAYLFSGLKYTERSRQGRAYEVMIVDEVDSMFLDTQDNPAIISGSSRFPSIIYGKLWEWLSTSKKQPTAYELRYKLWHETNQNYSEKRINTWIDSYKTAANYVEGKDYILLNNKIAIVDYEHTGEVKPRLRWQRGIHPLLEAKHNLTIRTEDYSSGGITHSDFFNLYPELYGLTGTMGPQEDRLELFDLYGVSTYDAPPYKASQKKQESHMLTPLNMEKIEFLALDVFEKMDAGRSILIISECISESNKIHEYLSTHPLKDKIKQLQKYNGLHSGSSELLISLAGNPNTVTIATNIAGRGTDISTTIEVAKRGGLHVIVYFPTINKRVETQAFGRTGRQGNPGTFRYIISHKELTDYINSADPSRLNVKDAKGSHEALFTLWHNTRNENNRKKSSERRRKRDLRGQLFLFQKLYFHIPNSDLSIVDWYDFYTTLEEDLEDVHTDIMKHYPHLNLDQMADLESKRGSELVFKSIHNLCTKTDLCSYSTSYATINHKFRTPLEFALSVKDRQLADYFAYHKPEWVKLANFKFETPTELARNNGWVDWPAVASKPLALQAPAPKVSKETSNKGLINSDKPLIFSDFEKLKLYKQKQEESQKLASAASASIGAKAT